MAVVVLVSRCVASAVMREEKTSGRRAGLINGAKLWSGNEIYQVDV